MEAASASNDRLELSIQLIAVTTGRDAADLRKEAADLILGRYESVLIPSSQPTNGPPTAPVPTSSSPASRPRAKSALASSPRQRAFIGRSLANVAEGHRVWCKGVEATTRSGRMWIGGEAFDTPTPAAKAAAARQSLPESEVNGWVIWRDAAGRTLAEIHDKVLRPV